MLSSCLCHLNQLWNISQRDPLIRARRVELWRMFAVREGWGVRS